MKHGSIQPLEEQSVIDMDMDLYFTQMDQSEFK